MQSERIHFDHKTAISYRNPPMKLSRCSVLDIYLGVPKKITEGGGRSHTGWNVPQYLKAQTVWWCNNRLEKYEFVNGVGIIPYMKWKIKHV